MCYLFLYFLSFLLAIVAAPRLTSIPQMALRDDAAADAVDAAAAAAAARDTSVDGAA